MNDSRVIHNFYSLRDSDGNIIVGMSYISGGVYIINNAKGESIEAAQEYTDEQMRNPLIAMERFQRACELVLRMRIKKALQNKGENVIMGCTSTTDCVECTKSGIYLESRCPTKDYQPRWLDELKENGII
ncbi:MAG: hypothetical protein QM689_12620 [Oscillospiraceae bacterium]